jgi:hypothetical protein
LKRGKCAGKKDNGNPCGAWASGEIGLCRAHERQFNANKRKEEERIAASKGELPPAKADKLLEQKPKQLEQKKDKPKKKPLVKKKEEPTLTPKPLTIASLMDTVAQTIADVQAGKVSEKFATSITKLAKIQADLLAKLPAEKEDDERTNAQLQEELAFLNGEIDSDKE